MVVESEIRQSKFRSICVYRDATIELGKELETQWQTCTKERLKWPLHSDAFTALPGGYGTLEVITWAQLGIHDKLVGLLNVDGYYNSLLSFMYKAVEEGFIRPTARQIVSAPTAKELVMKLELLTAEKQLIKFEQTFTPFGNPITTH